MVDELSFGANPYQFGTRPAPQWSNTAPVDPMVDELPFHASSYQFGTQHALQWSNAHQDQASQWSNTHQDCNYVSQYHIAEIDQHSWPHLSYLNIGNEDANADHTHWSYISSSVPINKNCQHANTILSGFSGLSNDQCNLKLSNQVCCALVNFQSIQTKSHLVNDYIIDHDIGIFFITETWVHDNLRDALILSAATPPGFAYLSFPRLNRRGGGIAVFHKKCLKINLLMEHHSDACEAVELVVKLGSNHLNVVIVYRAPSLSFPLLLNLMRDIFGHLVTSSQRRLLCVGDFNINMDNEHDHKTKAFQSLLDEFGLKQHVNVPTHKFGHILDLVKMVRLIQICYLQMVL